MFGSPSVDDIIHVEKTTPSHLRSSVQTTFRLKKLKDVRQDETAWQQALKQTPGILAISSGSLTNSMAFPPSKFDLGLLHEPFLLIPLPFLELLARAARKGR